MLPFVGCRLLLLRDSVPLQACFPPCERTSTVFPEHTSYRTHYKQSMQTLTHPRSSPYRHRFGLCGAHRSLFSRAAGAFRSSCVLRCGSGCSAHPVQPARVSCQAVPGKSCRSKETSSPGALMTCEYAREELTQDSASPRRARFLGRRTSRRGIQLPGADVVSQLSRRMKVDDAALRHRDPFAAAQIAGPRWGPVRG